MNQPSELEETLAAFNKKHNTKWIMDFLPKFRPEMNPKECEWAMIQYYCRQDQDGKIKTLRKSLKKYSGKDHLTIEMTRRFCRVIPCYNYLYQKACGLVETARVLRKHRSHRGYCAGIDRSIEFIPDPFITNEYYPEGVDYDHGMSEVTNDEECIFEDEDNEILSAEDANAFISSLGELE